MRHTASARCRLWAVGVVPLSPGCCKLLCVGSSCAGEAQLPKHCAQGLTWWCVACLLARYCAIACANCSICCVVSPARVAACQAPAVLGVCGVWCACEWRAPSIVCTCVLRELVAGIQDTRPCPQAVVCVLLCLVPGGIDRLMVLTEVVAGTLALYCTCS